MPRALERARAAGRRRPRSHLGIAVAAVCLSAPLSAALADDRDLTLDDSLRIVASEED